MNKKRLAALILVGIVTFVTVTVMESVIVQAAELGDRGPEVTAIQQDLRALGFVGVTVDGIYGAKTERAVIMFQRFNGLRVDGEAGPVTTARLDAAANALQPAVRLATPAPPAPVVHGNCAEWADEMAFFGVPDSMRSIMHRESRCDPGAVNSRSGSSGLFQIMPQWVPRLAPCGVYSRADLLDGVKNICGAAIILRLQGPGAWSL